MSRLFDKQIVDFFCVQQTQDEKKQLIQWVDAEIRKKVKSEAKSKDTKRFLAFVRQQVLQYLKEVFSGEGDDSNHYSFVNLYTRLWKLCLADFENPENYEKMRANIIQSIETRREKRILFLKQYMTEPKIADFIEWLETDSRPTGHLFNAILGGFVEQLTQTVLEKGIDVVLFPKHSNFIES